MKLNKLVLIPLTALLLVGCAQTPTEGNNNTSSSTSEATTDEEITLKMMGNIYENGYRTIYAFLKNGTNSEIGWKSSNEEVATVSPREGLTSEGNVIARGYGKTTITAYLEDYPGNKATMEIEIKKGEPMPEDLFNTLKGSLKVTSSLQLYDYDAKLNPTPTDAFDLHTIYEEIENHEKDDNTNTTDGFRYYATEKNSFIPQSKPINIVRGKDGYVSTEYRDIYNRISYERVRNEEFPDGEKWTGTVNYKNPFMNLTAYNDSFETFDGGKTYHFIGGDDFATNIVRGLFVKGYSPDDLYFKVLENNELELHIVFDPYNDDESQTIKYGSEYVSRFSEHGTAKIKHAELFEEKPYHANIIKALDEIKEKNYTVKYKLDYAGVDNDYFTEQIYKPTDILEIKTDLNGKETALGGVHKETDTTHIGYHKDYGSDPRPIDDVIYKKPLTGNWNNEFPTYNFSPLIFKEGTTANSYLTIDPDMGAFVGKLMRLPADFYMFSYKFEVGYLTLDENNHLKTVSTSVVDEETGDKINIDATFSNIGTSKIDLNFDAMQFEQAPTSWEQYGGSLYNSLVKWNLLDVIPFVYPKAYPTGGFESTSLYPDSDNAHIAFFVTNKFYDDDLIGTNEQARTAYINEFKEVLKGLGYTESNEIYKTNTVEIPFMKNDKGVMIGVGIDKDLTKPLPGGGLGNGFGGGLGGGSKEPKDNGRVRIVVQSNRISKPEN